MMCGPSRHLALFGSLLAILSGAWFALGNVFAPLWTVASPAGGPGEPGTLMRALEQVGFFTGLGIVIVLLAAVVAGRVTAVPGVVVATQPTIPVPRREAERREAAEREADETETIR